MNGVWIGAIIPSAGPVFQGFLDEVLDGAVRVQARAEIKGGLEGRGSGWGRDLGDEMGGESEVSAEGLEDVLPRAGGYFVANGDGLALLECADGIGDDAVEGPIAAADDVAGTGGGDRYGVVFEKGIPPGRDGDLAGGFAGAVGIVATERVALAVTVEPFAIFVNFVGGDEDGGAGLR